jgi:hypothetical protein
VLPPFAGSPEFGERSRLTQTVPLSELATQSPRVGARPLSPPTRLASGRRHGRQRFDERRAGRASRRGHRRSPWSSSRPASPGRRAQIAQLEKRVAAAPASSQQPKPARAKRRSREIDPGDAVPPGVAVQEPAPLDEEAETALENLEEHLGHG